MDLSNDLFGHVVDDGDVYHFSDQCPVGIPGHEHVCIKHHGKVLLFSTCSSQIDTAYRLALKRQWNMNTFPVVAPDKINRFKENTYINCNGYVELTEKEFGELCASGCVERAYGGGSSLSVQDMERVVNGIKLSTEIPDDIKALF